MKRLLLIALNILLLLPTTFAQKPGVWTPIFSFNSMWQIAEGDGKIYCRAVNALFSYDPRSGEIETLTKADRLHDVGIVAIAYYKPTKQLVVGYTSGNIDLVGSSSTIKISALRYNKSISNKAIHCITIAGSRAYIGADFGITVLNIDSQEYEDTYFIGANAEYLKVSQIAIDSLGQRIFAATPKGLMVASLTGENLADFNSWSLFQSDKGEKIDIPTRSVVANGKFVYASASVNDTLPAKTYMIDGSGMELFAKQPISPTSITVSNGLLHITEWKKISIYDQNNYLRYSADSTGVNTTSFTHAITADDGKVWACDMQTGITDMSSGKSFVPNGPFYDQISDIEFNSDNDLYASFGQNANNAFRIGGFGLYKNGWWLNRPEWSSFEMMTITLDPKKKEAFYLGSNGRGLFQYDGIYSLKMVYNPDNSLLEDQYDYPGIYRVTDIEIDKYGNLWIANWGSFSTYKVFDTKGVWHSFKLPEHPNYEYINNIFISSDNHKWGINALPTHQAYVISVFYENGTLDDDTDDKYTVIGLQGGEEQEFASNVSAIAEDKDGVIWIGTNNGIANMSDPKTVFTQSDPQFRRIKVTNDSIVDYLLEGVEVISIAVDAGNRKWFGTSNDGVFLMSDNGTEIIQHFTTDNSPLPSNQINKIAIRPSDGEVFFCSLHGTVSYRSDAYNGVVEMDKIKVVPNPVREDYRGDIYISGLVDEALVKITDISGNLVYETYSNGGMATWPGYNLLGNRPQTGVYFIFISNADGTSTRVGKLMFIN